MNRVIYPLNPIPLDLIGNTGWASPKASSNLPDWLSDCMPIRNLIPLRRDEFVMGFHRLLLLDDQVFSACNLIALDFQGVTYEEDYPAVSKRMPTPERRSLTLLVFTPFEICQDKKT